MAPAKPAQTLSPFEELDRWFEGFYPRGWMRPLQMDWPSWGEGGYASRSGPGGHSTAREAALRRCRRLKSEAPGTSMIPGA